MVHYYFSGAIHLHDVRNREHHVGTLTGHTQEVCGMQWSPDNGRLLATGGNDNQVSWGVSYYVHNVTRWIIVIILSLILYLSN